MKISFLEKHCHSPGHSRVILALLILLTVTWMASASWAETPEPEVEGMAMLQDLDEQGRLTVRALVAYGLLPDGFVQTAVALRSRGMDLLSADREDLQDWLNRSQKGQMDLQLHEKDLLKELVSIMTLEGKTASPPDEKREQPAGTWESPGMHSFGELGDAEGFRVRAFTPAGGTAVGDVETPEGVRAARWVRGKTPKNLGVLNELSSTSRATGVSDDGRVVVGWDVSLEGEQAFRWVKGQGMQRLEMMDGVEARAETAKAHAVNADGSVVVGGVGLRGKMTGYEHQRNVFRWVEGQGMRSLGSLQEGRESVATSVSADGRAIAGWGQTSEGDRAFRWVEGEGMQSLGAFELPGAAAAVPYSRGHAISGDGSAVVGSSHSADGERAFLWKQDKGLKNLGVLEGADWSRATAVNVDGTVVVGKSGAKKGLDSWTHAFLWSREQGMQDLGIQHGEGSSVARSVSPDGRVVMGERGSEEGKHPVVWVIKTGQEQVKTEDKKASEDRTQAVAVLVEGAPQLERWASAEEARTGQEVWAEYYGIPEEIENSIGMTLRFIPPGIYMRGGEVSSEETKQRFPEVRITRLEEEEHPRHQVTLTQGFYMSSTPVTQAQYQAVTGENPSRFEGEDRPVEQVSWHDAVAFSEKLTELERRAGNIGADQSYGLPTDAQWEYAARAGTNTAFHTGDDEEALEEAGWRWDWHEDRSVRRTQPVGLKEANAFRLYDMHGNVWEWCQDWFGEYPQGEVTDPTGPATGESRVLRGGGWDSAPANCRAAARSREAPAAAYNDFGFRVVLSLPGSVVSQ